MIHNEALFSIYFGDGRSQFIPTKFTGRKDLDDQEPFKDIKKRLNAHRFIFLHQVHGVHGMCITSEQQAATIMPFTQEGDFLITNVPQIGLAIATADCLPIALYDNFNNVIALIHAGWRGTIRKVAVHALERMHECFGTDPEKIKVFFGPSAKACCYKVGSDVIGQLEHFSYGREVMYKTENDIHLDVPLLNKLQLEEAGVKKDAFQLNYNICTMCNDSFCSYRREGPILERQLTMVALK